MPTKPPSSRSDVGDNDSARDSLSASPAPSVSSSSNVVIVQPRVEKPDYEDTSEESEIELSRPDIMLNGQEDSPVIELRSSTTPRSEDDAALVRQPGLSINLPVLSDEDKEDYDFLPNHFDVRRILCALGDNAPDRKFIVELASGEVDMVGL